MTKSKRPQRLSKQRLFKMAGWQVWLSEVRRQIVPDLSPAALKALSLKLVHVRLTWSVWVSAERSLLERVSLTWQQSSAGNWERAQTVPGGPYQDRHLELDEFSYCTPKAKA